MAAKYEPWLWEEDRYHNNCYNYAMNDQEGDYRQPGKLSHSKHSNHHKNGDFNIVNVLKNAIKDGMKPVPKNWKIPRGFHLVYLAFCEGWHTDYHWYRKDRGGYWSHKVGANSVEGYDRDGHRIKSPVRDALHYDYGVYGGFLIARDTPI